MSYLQLDYPLYFSQLSIIVLVHFQSNHYQIDKLNNQQISLAFS
ncbi:hypothetical protein NMS_0761 [Nonlabens marinus S1-08]|uniref:Uncharacterized protein n=1 Tax=Nonlabens marinus S1-08 TaxID=1454201 RepID=W8VQ07_9FLAO|nr:hypothetical protein NMS_0761 [Nonlabens marinus S1-08]